jgi:subtilisin family serine protease
MSHRFSLFRDTNSFKNKVIRLLLVFMLAFSLFASSGAGSNVPAVQAADSSNQIVVQLLPGRDILGLKTLLNTLVNKVVIKPLSLDDTYLLTLPLGALLGPILTLLNLSPLVVFAEPNYKLYSTEAQQAFIYYDTGSALQSGDSNPDAVQAARNQWAWQRIDLVRSQNVSEGRNVTVATLDTGVNANHPAIKDQLVPGYNALTGSPDATDDNGHGTFVAGVISQVAPDASIMPVKVLNNLGQGTVADASEGIFWAVNHNARVINMSLGLYTNSILLQLSINYAQLHGDLVVASAGNSGTASKRYPAAYPGVIGVAATDSNNLKASFSNYGNNARVSAPGVHIYSAYYTGGYAYGDGTSFAAPQVAALAAQVWANTPNSPPTTVSSRILGNANSLAASDPTYGNKLGAGLIDNFKAVGGS